MLDSMVSCPKLVRNALAQASSIAAESLLTVFWGLMAGQGLAWVAHTLFPRLAHCIPGSKHFPNVLSGTEATVY